MQLCELKIQRNLEVVRSCVQGVSPHVWLDEGCLTCCRQKVLCVVPQLFLQHCAMGPLLCSCSSEGQNCGSRMYIRGSNCEV